MDPDANLTEQRQLANAILIDPGEHQSPEATRLAELVLALDEWLVRSGFKPADWQASCGRCGMLS
jgi:hypothetical protein